MPGKKVNPKWVPLVKKLNRATKTLNDAITEHERVLNDTKKRLDASEKLLKAAIANASGLVDEVAKIPPGQYPAITDKPNA